MSDDVQQRIDEIYKDDPVGKELEESIRANTAILESLRYDVADRIAQAADGNGEYPSPHDVLALKKLETQVQSDKHFLRLRNLTRKRSGA